MNACRVRVVLATLCLVAVSLAGCGRGGGSDGDGAQVLRLAFVTNNSADFWTIARRGVEAADEELPDVEAEFRLTADGTAGEQQRIVDDLLTKGVAGIAISPIDPQNQTAMIDAAAGRALVFTQDSDAPDSARACYIGTDNVAAGRQAGQLILEAIPGGGEIMLFVGKLDAQNARERIQGIREALEGSAIEILDVRTDDGDDVRAKANAADTLVRYPDIEGLVGLWSYNGPAILNAVREAGRIGQVRIVAFDEADETLAGVRDGAIHATVVQQPYEFGYQSVRVLRELAKGNKDVIPADKIIAIPVKVVSQDTVDDFWQNLRQQRESGKSGPETAASGDKIQIAFVTNNPSDFWQIARAGVNTAMTEFGDVYCEFQMPADGTAADQQRIVEALIAKGISGMAISPNDAANQIDMINRACEAMNVICHDSDAPKSNRLGYVGTNNYLAGREAGKLIKQALPEGGSIMLFVGQMDAQNAQERRQGILDELEGKPLAGEAAAN
jgi:ribose transport system substrate-binding protein